MNSKPIQSACLALAATVTLVAGAVSPAMARSNDPAKDATKKSDDQSEKAAQKKYCVVGPSTGTMFPNRECHTRADWIALTGKDPVAKKN